MSDLATRAPDPFTPITVDDAMLDVVGALLHVEELQGTEQDAVDAHAPKCLPMQLIALEADQLGDAEAERALEDAIIANENEGLADGHHG